VRWGVPDSAVSFRGRISVVDGDLPVGSHPGLQFRIHSDPRGATHIVGWPVTDVMVSKSWS
jgi:hypothetical protein